MACLSSASFRDLQSCSLFLLLSTQSLFHPCNQLLAVYSLGLLQYFCIFLSVDRWFHCSICCWPLSHELKYCHLLLLSLMFVQGLLHIYIYSGLSVYSFHELFPWSQAALHPLWFLFIQQEAATQSLLMDKKKILASICFCYFNQPNECSFMLQALCLCLQCCNTYRKEVDFAL